jgi:hypothetical protein
VTVTDTSNRFEASFQQLSDQLIATLHPGEYLSLELSGEQSQFIRFSRAKVRQTGIVEDAMVTLHLINNGCAADATFPFTGSLATDLDVGLANLDYLRQELQQLPLDPYLVLPQDCGSSRSLYPGQLLPIDQAVHSLLPLVQGLDFTGLYAAGTVMRGSNNSVGQRHWFATESFFLDYSLIAPSEKAVKATLAGREWQPENYLSQIRQGKDQLAKLDAPIAPI